MKTEWMPVNPCEGCTRCGSPRNSRDTVTANSMCERCQGWQDYNSIITFQKKLLEHLIANLETRQAYPAPICLVGIFPETLKAMLKELEANSE